MGEFLVLRVLNSLQTLVTEAYPRPTAIKGVTGYCRYSLGLDIHMLRMQSGH